MKHADAIQVHALFVTLKRESVATHSDKIVTDTLNWYLKNFGTMVPMDQYLARLDVCAQCPELGKVTVINIEMDGCTKCGCPSETKPRVKHYFNPKKMKKVKVTCPLGKWAEVDQLFDN